MQSDPLRASVGHLLSKAYTMPCSTAAQAFSQLVQPIARFQLALDALLPLLDSPRTELSQRILVAYILYSLYAPHPIALNPFKSVLYDIFIKERTAAQQVSDNGGVGENEQLVWVLWKVLKGDGQDIGPYSPTTLARSPLPPRLRAFNLTLDEEAIAGKSNFDPFEDDTLSGSVGQQDASRTSSNGRQMAIGSGKPTTASNDTQDFATSSEEEERIQLLSHAMSLIFAARERVLTLSEQRLLRPLVSQLTSPSILTSLDLPPIIAHNPTIAHPLLVALLSQPPIKSNPQGASTYLEILSRLPPTLPTFDVLGQLLRDSSSVVDATTGGKTTVADVVRAEVLGRFIHESIQWLEKAEKDEHEGLISDDRFATGVRNLCRFFSALMKLGIVDPSSDADSAEMAHFALRTSRLEEANALYRLIAASRF
ncbi:hypothetical protein DENSPDRAFT_768129 [Dentipellis sp. KUC8613]|nr:hypothetical protein DENSPDRAFT_768129 [Dentipellis sp. KUC8613]